MMSLNNNLSLQTNLAAHWVGCLTALASRNFPAVTKHFHEFNRLADRVKDPALAYSQRQLAFVVKAGRFPAINFMGTMGSGKSRIAEAFAKENGFKFVDADIFHPKENKEKMGRGEALTMEERIPFVEQVQSYLASGTVDEPVVTTCSGLTPAILASMAGAPVKETLTSDQNPWNSNPQNIVLQVWVTKPKELALFELDRSAKNQTHARVIGEEAHFIIVTYENHQILNNQYLTIGKTPPKPFQVVALDVSSFHSDDKYDNQAMADYLRQVVPVNKF